MSEITQFSPFRLQGQKIRPKGAWNLQPTSVVADPVGLGAGDAGLQWYRSDIEQYRYWTGTAVSIFESSSSGVDDLVEATLATVSGATALTVSNSTGITWDIPVSGVDALLHSWKWTIDGNNALTISATGDGAGGITGLALMASAPLIFDTGSSVTAGSYWLGRDNDVINQFHLNIPSGTTFEFSVNDVKQVSFGSFLQFTPTGIDDVAFQVTLASGASSEWTMGNGAVTVNGGHYDITLGNGGNANGANPSGDGGGFGIFGGQGGAASGIAGGDAGVGTGIQIFSGRGGDGSATQVSGVGGNVELRAGRSGVNGGNGLGTGGYILFQVDNASSALVDSLKISAGPVYNFAGSADIELNQILSWDTGRAVTAGQYQIGRNNAATNLMQYEVPTGSAHQFTINGVEKARFTTAGSTGSLQIFQTTAPTPAGILQLSSGSAGTDIFLDRYATGNNANGWVTRKAGGSEAVPTAAAAEEQIGYFLFAAHDGTAFRNTASLEAVVDGTVGLNDMPSRLMFKTTPDGSASALERFRINNAGTLIAGRGEAGTTAATGATLRAPNITTGGAGNVAGADLTLVGGLGTGTGQAGRVIIQSVNSTVAGDNLQTVSDALIVFNNTFTFALQDNTATAFVVKQAPDNYIVVNTTNASENISFGNAVTNPSYTYLGTGTVAMPSVNIDGGTIDGTTIGGVTPAAGTFTTIVDENAGLATRFRNTTDSTPVEVSRFEGFRATEANGDTAYLGLRLKNSADASFEYARIGWRADDVLAGSEDGVLQFSVVTANTMEAELGLNGNALHPITDGGLSLGLNTLAFNGIHLNTGTAINWENGDVTLTHGANSLSFAGALAYNFDYVLTFNGAGTLSGSGYQVGRAGNDMAYAVPETASNEKHLFKFGATTLTTIATQGVSIAQQSFSAGNPLLLALISSSHSGIPSLTQLQDIYYDGGNRTLTWTGAGGTLDNILVSFDIFPTYAFANATDVVHTGMEIVGGALNGANSTITQERVLDLSTNTGFAGTTDNTFLSFGTIDIQNGIGAIGTITLIGQLADTGTLGNQIATRTNLNSIRFEAQTYTALAAVAVTKPVKLYLEADIASTNVTFTNPALALHIGSGASRFDGAIVGKQGTDIASASTIVIPRDGNVFELTGTTAVNLITTTGYQDGFQITLIANENVTINHGTATSGANVTILLSAAGNFAMTANDTLTLVLSSTTAGGQAWREVARTAI